MVEHLTIKELYEEFEELHDWDERCDYLIDLGFNLPQLPDDAKTEDNRVHGCQSNELSSIASALLPRIVRQNVAC